MSNAWFLGNFRIPLPQGDAERPALALRVWSWAMPIALLVSIVLTMFMIQEINASELEPYMKTGLRLGAWANIAFGAVITVGLLLWAGVIFSQLADSHPSARVHTIVFASLMCAFATFATIGGFNTYTEKQWVNGELVRDISFGTGFNPFALVQLGIAIWLLIVALRMPAPQTQQTEAAIDQ